MPSQLRTVVFASLPHQRWPAESPPWTVQVSGLELVVKACGIPAGAVGAPASAPHTTASTTALRIDAPGRISRPQPYPGSGYPRGRAVMRPRMSAHTSNSRVRRLPLAVV